MHRLIREGAEEGSCGGEGKYSKKAKNSESESAVTGGGLGLAHLFVGEGCSGTVRKGACEGQCEISKKAKKDDLLNWP